VDIRHHVRAGVFDGHDRRSRSTSNAIAEPTRASGTARALDPAGGSGGNLPTQSSCEARASHDPCIRNSSSRSDTDTAFAANMPHAAALLRNRVARSSGDGSGTMRSFLQAGARPVSQPPAPGFLAMSHHTDDLYSILSLGDRT
jgi:hypothetical protein